MQDDHIQSNLPNPFILNSLSLHRWGERHRRVMKRNFKAAI